jgi:hypothetical protein
VVSKLGIELVVRDVCLTGGVPHSIPEGGLKLAKCFRASALAALGADGSWGAPRPPWSRTCPQRRRHPDRVPPRSRTASWPVLSAVERTEGAERHARERGYRDLQQTVGAMVLPRAVSHVAHDYADELIEVNRALPRSPGLLISAETEAALSIVGKLMK